MNKNNLLTLPELAKREGITEDAARKRAERGWYEKIKLGNRTYYRDMMISEPAPEPVKFEIPELPPPPPRPEKEPFPGAWEISETFKKDYSWVDVEQVGKELDGDGEAVGYWFFMVQALDIALEILGERVKSGEDDLANLSRMTKTDAINAVLNDLHFCFECSLLDALQKWMDAGKPRVAPRAVLEMMAADGDDEAKAALEMYPQKAEANA